MKWTFVSWPVEEAGLSEARIASVLRSHLASRAPGAHLAAYVTMGRGTACLVGEAGDPVHGPWRTAAQAF